MIRLTRIRREAVIHENFRGERKRSFEKELLVNQRRLLRGEIEGHTFNSDRWKPAKEQLLTETLGKCAYCEAPMSTVAYGDVEYYRPKSVYWWLAYCIDNYLASCQLCNQKFKKAFFPIKNTIFCLSLQILQKRQTEVDPNSVKKSCDLYQTHKRDIAK